MLKSEESLFKNEYALDYEFLPKLLPYRESEQKYLAECIKPLFQGRNGRNLLIHGAPGIGKTAAMKFVFRDLEDETEEIIPIYINCWQKNTTYKVMIEICDVLGYSFTHNKRTDELFSKVQQLTEGKAVVFTFDEIDKLEDYDFLYSLLEQLYKKTIFLITNYEEWLEELDERIRSRLLPEKLEFKKYTLEETKGILKERLGYAFVEGVWDADALDYAINESYRLGDVRTGLFILRQAGMIAEEKLSRKILKDFVDQAIKKLGTFSSKKPDELEDESQSILNMIKENSGKRIGDLYKIYQKKGGQVVYKTFQRKVRKLADSRFISVEKMKGGTSGSTTMVYAEATKTLDNFDGFVKGDKV